jgi:glutathione synthase/RimK-type ligase-like ATP-grasp enzyme
MPKNIYIYYSGATDKTGKLLTEALEVEGGRKSPGTKKKIVIGWGAKTKKDANLGNATVVNHPDRIRDNRNKFKALEIMLRAGVSVAPFTSSGNVLSALDADGNAIKLPIIARTNYHQGGRNFITCLTRTHVDEAIKQLAAIGKQGYFQNYIDVREEFRLHVMDGAVIYAQRKIPRDNMKTAYVDDQMDKIKRMAEKKGKKVDEETLKFALDYQGDKITGPDLVVKSNTRGYKFSSIKLKNVNEDLAGQAIRAVEALGLQFGAVDCVLDADGSPWVIEVNTGPGLEGSSFRAYVTSFAEVINNILKPPKVAAREGVNASEVTKAASAKAGDGVFKVQADKLRALADLLDHALDDNERDVINKVAARITGAIARDTAAADMFNQRS